MKRTLAVAVVLTLFPITGLAEQAAPPDAGTGFFRLQRRAGRWWIVDPKGEPFYSLGVCVINPGADHAPSLGYSPYHRNIVEKYGSEKAWAEQTRQRLLEWGFNTRGAWCSGHVDLPEFLNLSFSAGHWVKGNLPDFFDPAFVKGVEAKAGKRVRPDDPSLIGYFLDNEMQWETDWRLGPPLFDLYAKLPREAAGKCALADFFRKRYASVERLAEVWSPAFESWDALLDAEELTPVEGASARAAADREAFTLTVARQYFRVTTQAVRKHDPNHLVAGCRFVSWLAPVVVVQACGEFCDICSINHYEMGPMGMAAYHGKKHAVRLFPEDATFSRFYQVARKPLLITEFSFRAMDSGMPNTYPPPLIAQPTVPDQTARAAKYRSYAETWARQPYFLGNHWFQYMDEPKEGRFDGENGNYGLVNIKDAPYDVFIKVVKETNNRIPDLHGQAEPQGLLDEVLVRTGELMRLSDSDFQKLMRDASLRQDGAPAETVAAALATACRTGAASIRLQPRGPGAEARIVYSSAGQRRVNSVEEAFGRRLHGELKAIAASRLPLIGAGAPGAAFEVAVVDEGGKQVVVLKRR